MVSPGDSSVPASNDPIITQSAPEAMALAISPLYFIPPSAMTGMPLDLHASTTLCTAVSCGTPTPETILVVQIEPGPIPTLTALAPASIRALAAAPVAILPAMIVDSGDFALISATVSITPWECPCAVSITIASAPASIRAMALLTPFTPVPVAAATLSLPWSSLQDNG